MLVENGWYSPPLHRATVGWIIIVYISTPSDGFIFTASLPLTFCKQSAVLTYLSSIWRWDWIFSAIFALRTLRLHFAGTLHLQCALALYLCLVLYRMCVDCICGQSRTDRYLKDCLFWLSVSRYGLSTYSVSCCQILNCRQFVQKPYEYIQRGK